MLQRSWTRKGNQTRMKVFASEQAATSSRLSWGERLEACLQQQLLLGYRQGEALGLQWPDVDLAKGTLTVRQALQRVNGNCNRFRRRKIKCTRSLYLPVTISALHAHDPSRTKSAASQALSGRKPDSCSQPDRHAP